MQAVRFDPALTTCLCVDWPRQGPCLIICRRSRNRWSYEMKFVFRDILFLGGVCCQVGDSGFGRACDAAAGAQVGWTYCYVRLF